MSDEKTEREWKPAPIHEMSETPFGGGFSSGDTDHGSVEPAEEPTKEQPAQEQEPEAVVEPQEPESEGTPEPSPPQPQEAQEPMSMEAAMAEMAGQGVDYSGTLKSLRVGDVVDGTVVHIDREGVLVDVGTKSEGVIRPGELARDPSLTPEQVVSVGEKIKVYVVESESQEGGPVLSKKRADFENAWDRVEKAYSEGGILKAMVTDRVKGGLVVDLGIRGFVPASHVGSGKLKNLERFVGQSMPFKVIEVDRDRRKVVLSNRLAIEEEQQSLRKETLASLREGQIRDGIVRRITDYGAFVDLGGVDGLLHISEMSWTRISHPSEAVKVGQKIQVMVLKLNLEQGRVSLGLRQILPDPWEDIRRLYSVGDVITGTVTRLVPFGAFVQVEGGIEGIIPNSELAQRRVNNPEEVVSSGQQVEVKIIDLRPDERRMTLSLRQLQVQKERERDESEYRAYTQTRGEAGRMTIGDLVGEQLGDLGLTRSEAEKPPKKKSRARAARRQSIEEAEALAEVEVLDLEEQVEPQAELKTGAATEAAAGAEDITAAGVETEAPAGEATGVPAEDAEPPAVEEKPKPERKRRTRAKPKPEEKEAAPIEAAESAATQSETAAPDLQTEPKAEIGPAAEAGFEAAEEK